VIVFWNGLGFIALLVIVLGVLLMQLAGQLRPNERWPQLLLVLATSVSLFGIGWALNRRRVVAWDRRGNTIQNREKHSLYWIPVEYWSAIFLAAGTAWVMRLW
jgi:hypothetical protein